MSVPILRAVIYPDNPLGFNESDGERAVFDAVRSLDNRCSVFYSLAWLNPQYRGYSKFSPLQRKADFVENWQIRPEIQEFIRKARKFAQGN